MKKLLSIVALNLLIGNLIAWFMGAAPIDFPLVEYSPQEQQLITGLSLELADPADDITVQIQLGAQYSLHNQLDEASRLLTAALTTEADNALALAWLSGTRAKQAGAMFDPLMGLVKLYRLHGACAGLNRAVSLDPDNFELRMIRLATFAPTALLNCDLDTAFADEIWFTRFFAQQGKSAPLELKLQFRLSMSQAYANAGKEGKAQAQQYLNEFRQMARDITLSPLLQYQLAQTSELLAENS